MWLHSKLLEYDGSNPGKSSALQKTEMMALQLDKLLHKEEMTEVDTEVDEEGFNLGKKGNSFDFFLKYKRYYYFLREI